LNRLARRGKDSTGTSLVEAAFITPLLLLLTFSVVDFASLFYVYLALENGVSQASRYGVTGNVSGALSHEDSIIAAMRDATPSLTIDDAAFTFSHMAPGGAVWLAGAGAPRDISKVTVNYDWSLMTPLIRDFFPGGKLSIRVESAMMNEPRFN
jgi:hypothetical protein